MDFLSGRIDNYSTFGADKFERVVNFILWWIIGKFDFKPCIIAYKFSIFIILGKSAAEFPYRLNQKHHNLPMHCLLHARRGKDSDPHALG